MRGINRNNMWNQRLFSVCRRYLMMGVALLAVPLVILAQDAPVRVPPSEASQAVISKVKPVYPEMARKMRLSGQVELEAVVNEQGEVETVEIKSGNPILRMAARDALKQWKFKPFTRDGRPVKAIVTVTFDFQPEA